MIPRMAGSVKGYSTRIKLLRKYHDNEKYGAYPPGTSATDKVENIPWLGEADEWLSTVTFTLSILFKHRPVRS